MEILLHEDDSMLPAFCDALRENRQQHVVDIITGKGLPFNQLIN